MAVRKQYKIPFTIDTGPMDIEMNLTPSNSNVTVSKRPITLKLFMFAVLGVLIYFAVTFQTPIKSGSIISIIFWTLAYFGFLLMCLSPTKTKQLGYSWIKPSLEFLLKINRHVGTKSKDFAAPVAALYDVRTIHEDGKITFYNGDVGRIYGIVGYGSVLMFSSDRDNVLEDTNTFYRNLPTGVTLIFDTRQSPQKVDAQLANLKEQASKVQVKSKGLRDLQKEEFYVMKNYVGREFKSTHQIMIARAADDEHLDGFEEHLSGSSGNAFLRSAELFEQEDVKDYIKELRGA